MNFDALFDFLMSVSPVVGLILHILGTLVVLATVYVKLTPNQNDDAWFAKLEAIPILGVIIEKLMNFSYVQRKDK